MIEEDQGIALKVLKESILADFQLNVAISTIHNYLEGRLLTLKKVHYIAAYANDANDANNVRNKALRVEYVQAISAHMQNNKTIIWMDETNVNLYFRRTQERAPADQRAAVALLESKGPNVHAITNFQIFYSLGVDVNQVVFVCDNAPCHSKVQELKLDFPGLAIKCLGPYSPMLNPM